MARGLDRVKGRNSAQTWMDHTIIKGLDQRYYHKDAYNRNRRENLFFQMMRKYKEGIYTAEFSHKQAATMHEVGSQGRRKKRDCT